MTNLLSSSSIAISIIGKGTYGTVIKMKSNNKYYAKKRQREGNYGIECSSVRECTALNIFKHPFIMPSLEIETSLSGKVDIYMALAKSDLHQWINENNFSDRVELFPHVLFRMLSALSYIHKFGFIHRDVKPSNILIDRYGCTFLSDFGSCKEICNETMYNKDNCCDGDDSNNNNNIDEYYPNHTSFSSSSSSSSSFSSSSSSFTLSSSLQSTIISSLNPSSHPSSNSTPLPLVSPLSSSFSSSSFSPPFSSSYSPLMTTDMITYVYRPPEVSGTNYGKQSDIYSLGCSMIHLLVGKYPSSPKRENKIKKDEAKNNIDGVDGANDEKVDPDPPTPSAWKQLLTEYLENRKALQLYKNYYDLLICMIDENVINRPSADELLTNQIFTRWSTQPVHGSLPYYNNPTFQLSTELKDFIQIIGNHLNIQPFLIHRTCWIFDDFVKIYPFNHSYITSLIPQSKQTNSLLLPNQLNLKCVIMSCLRLVLKLFSKYYDEILSNYEPVDFTHNEWIKMESVVFATLRFNIWRPHQATK